MKILIGLGSLVVSAQAVALPYKGKRFRQLLLLPAAGSPDARSAGALAASLGAGGAAALAAARSALDSPSALERVRLQLPRLRLEFGPTDLKPQLSAAGLAGAFNGVGGFLGMADDRDLHLSKVFHKAVVEVNEEGTEAAAATAAVMMTRSVRIEPPPVRFCAAAAFALLCFACASAKEHADPRGDPALPLSLTAPCPCRRRRFPIPSSPQKEFIVDRPFVLVIEDTHTGAPLFMGRVVSPSFTGLDSGGAAAEAAI